ncbi:hypothetical protein BGZ72_001636 [Mortierella alpina]|nr:hypothetical protein BGZ72_001636 [Mortierella alpina]
MRVEHLGYAKAPLVFFLLLAVQVAGHAIPQSGDDISATSYALNSANAYEWEKPDSYNNTIPDFSRVGYREGHVAIPKVPVQEILKPSGLADDTARIQAAIDKVGNLPLKSFGKDGAKVRGTVLLKKGTYKVAGALIINKSGVVLRGEGKTAEGTTIIATGKIQRDFILVNGMLSSSMGSTAEQKKKARTREMMPRNGYKSSGKPETQSRKGVYISVRTTIVPVDDTTGFNVNDKIVIERPGSEQWIKDIGMNYMPPRGDSGRPSTQWTPKSYTFRFERTIVAIDRTKRTFTIDIPLVMNFDPKYPPVKIYHLVHKSALISDVGVENLRLVSEYDSRNPEDEQHGWYAVVVDNAIHGWVADVRTERFVSGIFASMWSRFVTIQDCAVVDPVSKPSEGGRRYPFNLSGQMGLVKRCFTNNARHEFVTHGRLCGPNVFVDSKGEHGNNDSGPHERWAMGVLYDNISAHVIHIRNRMWYGSGQGWAGAFHVFYNCEGQAKGSYFQDAPGTINWVIGFKGHLTNKFKFEGGKPSKLISYNKPVQPRSLYWSQLAARTGKSVEELMKIH